jgi:hypothetical protein
MKPLLLGFVLFGITVAEAADRQDVWGPGALHPVLPPVEYDHPFAGELLVIDELERQSIRDNCGSWGREYDDLAACAYHDASANRCVVLLAKKAERHEIGHCNGWPQSHEGARWGLNDPDWSKPAIRPNPGD